MLNLPETDRLFIDRGEAIFKKLVEEGKVPLPKDRTPFHVIIYIPTEDFVAGNNEQGAYFHLKEQLSAKGIPIIEGQFYFRTINFRPSWRMRIQETLSVCS